MRDVSTSTRHIALLAVSGIFLVVEAGADAQKAAYVRDLCGRKYCDSWLYRLVRFPQYAAELSFWTCLSAVAFDGARPLHKVPLPACPLYVYVILARVSAPLGDSAVRKRTTDDEHKQYVRRPALFPLSKQHSFTGRGNEKQ